MKNEKNPIPKDKMVMSKSARNWRESAAIPRIRPAIAIPLEGSLREIPTIPRTIAARQGR